MDEPKTVAFDKLPKDIKALHKCATAEHSLEVAFEPYARLVVFFVTCPAPRGALTPYAVYVARDSKGTAAKRIKFEALAADGSTTTLDTLFSATPAREAYTKPDDPQPNLSSKNDVAWITGAWGPEDRPGVCAVAAIWRLQGDKAEVRFWEEAKECPKGETPKYETKLDKKPPPLVAP
jgi:hypothetical protein